jgi:hypothetical protein
MSDERQHFLSLLEQPLCACAPCRFEYGQSSPCYGTVLTVSVEGRSGRLRIGAFTIADRVLIYADPFPGDGIPHYQMYAVDEHDRLGERFVSCRIESVVGAFKTQSPEAEGFGTRSIEIRKPSFVRPLRPPCPLW